VLAADLATPAFAVHAPAEGRGVLVLVEPATRVGLSCLTLEESDDRTRARLIVGAPGVREDVGYAAGNTRLPSKDRGAAFRAGDTVVLRLRVHVFDCPDAQGLFDVLAVVRKDLTGPTAHPAELPFSAAFKAHEARVNRRFVEETGIFSLDAREGSVSWQSGWCGGLAATLPLLGFGAPLSRARAAAHPRVPLRLGASAVRVLRSVFDGKRWLDDGPTPAPASSATAPSPSREAPREGAREAPRRTPSSRHLGRWHLVRRSADALTFAAKQLMVMRRLEPGLEVDGRWLAGSAAAPTRSCGFGTASAARPVRRRRDRRAHRGRLDVRGLAPAGLALAAALLKRDDYLATAQAVGEQFYERYVRAGLTCGGPGDALQCPDGESAAALLESFVTVFEQTGEAVVARAGERDGARGDELGHFVRAPRTGGRR